MNVGDRIRVKETVIVYHYPKSRNKPFDLKGMEGEIVGIATQDPQGTYITANLPLIVKFEGKFRAHLKEEEVEALES